VAGTAHGVTALQMDIKIEGINEEIMETALAQAREGRLHILQAMNAVLPQSRPEVNGNAPTYASITINPEKIRDVIGKGGATIRALCEETKATIDIDDSGLVRIYGETKGATQAALAKIQAITAEVEVGTVYEGRVARIVDFGAFVTILPGTDGLVHISQIANERVENVSDYLKEGQTVKVRVLDVDQRGRIKLSMKDLASASAAHDGT
jgi:polyribonucleotide nucleotidyltransferase